MNSLFNFDEIVDRRGSGSIKWDKYKDKDILPLWVADMDFRSPPAVLDELRHHLDHGVLGYSLPKPDVVDSLLDYLLQRYQWKVQPEWVVWIPGLVCGLNLACRAVGEEGDSVLTTIPIYPPFLSSPKLSKRTLKTITMDGRGKGWTFPHRAFAEALDEQTKLFLLCHPHNPTGRVFEKKELEQMAEQCLKNDTIICSDEVHCDLIYGDKKHIPMATLSEEVAEKTITFMAPSKTYNLPGMSLSVAIIPDLKLRKKFLAVKEGIVTYPGGLSYAAAKAAWSDCEPWRQELLEYLNSNRKLIEDNISNLCPGINVHSIEATYLAWLDVRGIKQHHPARFFEEHGVGLSDGRDFGMNGYLRLNFGCTKATLNEALERMSKAVKQ